MSDRVDTDAVRRLADAATPGPWLADIQPECQEPNLVMVPAFNVGAYHYVNAHNQADAEFIAAARTLVPALCDELDRTREALRTVRPHIWNGRIEQACAIIDAVLAESGNTDRCPTCGSTDPNVYRCRFGCGATDGWSRGHYICHDPHGWHRATDTEGE